MAAFQYILESPFRWALRFGSGLARRVENQVGRWREMAAHRYEPNG
ncbi:hypothetical protein M8R20_07855 [Pseudomonas sp. R2.Fl]|nr:hypothetical protein [Pseudomonas sp. R2.Fl]